MGFYLTIEAHPLQMRRQYTADQKLRVIRDAKETSINADAKKYKVDRRSVRRWIEKEEELSVSDSASFRLPGAGRKLSDYELECLLVEQITDARLEKIRVTRSRIIQWAKELADDETNLSSSSGWLEKFLQRHNFVLRKVTNKPSLRDTELVDRASRFILHVKRLIMQNNIRLENIYCLDETALFFDHSDARTIHFSGARHVQVIFCANNQVRSF